jgi:hypothetical protein
VKITLRHRLIRWLARGDTVLMNCAVEGCSLLGRGGLFVHNVKFRFNANEKLHALLHSEEPQADPRSSGSVGRVDGIGAKRTYH